MTTFTRRELLLLAGGAGIAGFAGPNLFAQRPYYPRGNDWETRPPGEAGLDAARLDEAVKYTAEHNSTGFVVVRAGRIVSEHYWNGWTQQTAEPIFSSSKSVTSVLVGMAIEEKLIKGVNQSASDFVTSWKGTPKEAITIRHMLTMTSGIRVGPAAVSPEIDAFEQNAALPLEHQPGEFWAYNTPVYRMLIRVLEIASKEKIDAFTNRKLSGPLGMSASKWDCETAPRGQTNCTWYRANLRDMSRFGLMVLRHGKWEDRQVISEAFLEESTNTSQKLNESYGYLWWLNGKPSFKRPAAAQPVKKGMMWPDCPADAFGALGAMDKKILIVPSLDLVVSRHGPSAGIAGEGGPASFDNQLLGRVCRAIKT